MATWTELPKGFNTDEYDLLIEGSYALLIEGGYTLLIDAPTTWEETAKNTATWTEITKS
jgi:hypothetical protein